MADRTVNQSVDCRQRVRILRARLIKVCVIYTHSPFTIRLFDHHNIGQPCCVVGFLNKTSLY